MRPDRSFQDLILTLQRYWAEQGCVILQPYDVEMGAGTFHPATTLRALGPKPWRAAYVQPSRRPKDGRYGENPNRLQHYYQFQVIMKPSPPDLQDLYLNSLPAIGLDMALHDVRFVEDDWESPTLGAWGLGWECWCDGMEVSQFTYFQQVAGFECAPVSGELTYGLERLAMYVQGVETSTTSTSTAARAPRRSPMATSSCRPSRNIRATISNMPTPRCSSAFRGRRARVPALLERGQARRAGIRRASARAAGLRPVHQGEPRLQPSRRARRHRGDRAAELHPARPRAGQGLRRRLARDQRRRRVIRFDHVNIRVIDQEAMRDFLAAVVGLKVGPRPPFDFHGYWLYLGDVPVIHLVCASGRARSAGSITSPSPATTSTRRPPSSEPPAPPSTQRLPDSDIRQIFVDGPEASGSSCSARRHLIRLQRISRSVPRKERGFDVLVGNTVVGEDSADRASVSISTI